MKVFSIVLAAIALATVTAQTPVPSAAAANKTEEYSKKEGEIHEYELGKSHGSGSEDSHEEYEHKKHGSGSDDSHEEYGSKAGHKGKHVGSHDEDSEEYGSKAGAKNSTVPSPSPSSGAASFAGIIGASVAVATAVAASLL